MHVIRMFVAVLIMLTASSGDLFATTDKKAEMRHINRSVVKIYTSYRRPNYSEPWQYKAQQNAIGSGVVIEGKRILTNAHIVADTVYLEVSRANDPKKYRATVAMVGNQCDLAVLTIDDQTFFEAAKPLPFGDLPEPLDRVVTYGFPRGGKEISITQGVVSRIEVTRYAHSGFSSLGIQIDAAINPGNSGGPVVREGKLIGVAMQALRSGENIGYIIPTPVIRHFLTDISDGQYDGFPDDGLTIQLAESPALRAYYGLASDQTGVIVIKIAPDGSSDGLLEVGDVITHVDGVSIANDATTSLTDALRVSADFLVQKHQVGDTVSMSIIRDHKVARVSIPLKKPNPLAPRLFGERPPYLIYGGVVFTKLTRNFISQWSRGRSAPLEMRQLVRSGHPTKERSEVVILRRVLSHQVNAGYHRVANRIVEKINGVAIGSMAELKQVLTENHEPFTVIELNKGLKLVLDNEAVAKAEAGLLGSYGIAESMSAELR